VKKTFDGKLKGESAGEILMYSAADGSAAYTISDIRRRVDFASHPQSFYDHCGFKYTAAGLINLRQKAEIKFI